MAPDTDLGENEWSDGVYYDRSTGEFVTFEFTDETVREETAHEGDEVHVFDRDDFEDSVDEFTEVDPRVVANPASVVETVLETTFLEGEASPADYDALDVMYARQATTATNTPATGSP